MHERDHAHARRLSQQEDLLNSIFHTLNSRLNLPRLTMVLMLTFFNLMARQGVAQSADWKSERPDAYRVVQGDTLWSIADRFLKKPWEWPEVWHGNPEIRNPRFIYPGDLIVVDRRGGHDFLRLESATMDRLSPRIRVTPIQTPVPAIPYRAIGPFLTYPRVLEATDLERLPYVVDIAEEHVVAGPGDRLFVRSIHRSQPSGFTVIRAGDVYRDAETGAELGSEAIYIAEGTLEQTGDPATVTLMRAEKEARQGDRLTPSLSMPVDISFEPHSPPKNLYGSIIGVMDGVSQIGQFSVVALDRGRLNGVGVGQVFQVWQKGPALRDEVQYQFGQHLQGPEQRAGLLMVFLVYQRVSFALVLKSEKFIHVLDTVRTP